MGLTTPTYDFSYTNTTASTHDVTPVAIGPVANYAKVTDEPKLAELSNKTASLEQPELLTYYWEKKNQLFTKVTPRNPAPTKGGVVYQCRLDSILRVTDGDNIVDEPIAIWLTVAHPASNSWTNSRVAGCLMRLLGGLQKADGTWRFEDLMRSALVPTQD